MSTGGHAVVDLDVVVECSSGCYVRALARDLGIALGTGGHLTALRRTRVGPFMLDEAQTFDTNTSNLTCSTWLTSLDAASPVS
jgi:tRNA pseudouridine55 synthase